VSLTGVSQEEEEEEEEEEEQLGSVRLQHIDVAPGDVSRGHRGFPERNSFLRQSAGKRNARCSL